MMSIFWTRESDIYNPLVIFEEEVDISYALPVDHTANIQLISGSLPDGIELVNSELSGTPPNVVNVTAYIVVFRATKGVNFEDRTFLLRVVYKNQPVWITPAGRLSLGNGFSYVPDSFFLDYQLLATDADLVAGEILRFYQSGGELPPGVYLTESGRLQGIIGAYMANSPTPSSLDDFFYQTYPYTHTSQFVTGYNSAYYDLTDRDDIISDLLANTRFSRIYRFQVSVYDGKTEPVPRDFEIAVAGDSIYLVTVTTLITSATGGIAGLVAGRVPQWITHQDLGFARSNSNITLYLDIVDPTTMTGFATYQLLSNNPDGSPSYLPDSIVLDTELGILYGNTPRLYTNRIDYQFTIRARSIHDPSTGALFADRTFTLSVIDDKYSVIVWKTPVDLGVIKFYEQSTIKLTSVSSNTDTVVTYRMIGGELPPGLTMTSTGNIMGQVTYLPTDQTVFNFTVVASDRRNNEGIHRTFQITVDNLAYIPYNDIWLMPYMQESLRTSYHNMIGDIASTFADQIYLYGNPAFGVCNEPMVLFYSGIESEQLNNMLGNSIQFPPVQLLVNGASIAYAYTPGTRDIQYEVVYLNLISIQNSMESEDGFYNLSNLKLELMNQADMAFRQERLWIRSLPTYTQHGIVLTLPLVYCKPGNGKLILSKLLSSEHDIYQYNMHMDRLMVNRIGGNEFSYIYFVDQGTGHVTTSFS